MKKTIVCCAMVSMAAALMLSGCGGSQNPNQAANAEVSIREALETADPKGAVEAIYAEFEEPSLTELDGRGLTDYFNVQAADLTSFVAFRSDAKSGLCDVAILQPGEGKRDEIRELLYAYKTQRVDEFRNYDIKDAYSIAQNAVVLDQGDYVILLMLPDNDAALDVLDQYIPQ